ncbi:hypothetical protein BB561_000815 [Smittium simulii]|uniref:Uncharacterized protein n=1 Tax=Smittium simulii TaxID=133385 RepID=A0A2T9YXI8_9FUNG|nr:hypothetical protein BB561_000815 [Smittium simulii]
MSHFNSQEFSVFNKESKFTADSHSTHLQSPKAFISHNILSTSAKSTENPSSSAQMQPQIKPGPQFQPNSPAQAQHQMQDQQAMQPLIKIQSQKQPLAQERPQVSSQISINQQQPQPKIQKKISPQTQTQNSVQENQPIQEQIYIHAPSITQEKVPIQTQFVIQPHLQPQQKPQAQEHLQTEVDSSTQSSTIPLSKLQLECQTQAIEQTQLQNQQWIHVQPQGKPQAQNSTQLKSQMLPQQQTSIPAQLQNKTSTKAQPLSQVISQNHYSTQTQQQQNIPLQLQLQAQQKVQTQHTNQVHPPMQTQSQKQPQVHMPPQSQIPVQTHTQAPQQIQGKTQPQPQSKVQTQPSSQSKTKPKASLASNTTKTTAPYKKKSLQVPLRQKLGIRIRQLEQLDFEEKKIEFYKKRSEIKEEIKLILTGKHPAFKEALQKFTEERDKQLKEALDLREYKMKLFESELKEQEAQAIVDYENEKKALIDHFVANIEERKRKIKEEKDLLEVTSDYLLESSRSSNKRTLRNRAADLASTSFSKTNLSAPASRKKQVQNFAVVGLSEEEIVADLVELRKFTGIDGPLALPTASKKPLKASKR